MFISGVPRQPGGMAHADRSSEEPRPFDRFSGFGLRRRLHPTATRVRLGAANQFAMRPAGASTGIMIERQSRVAGSRRHVTLEAINRGVPTNM